MPDAVAIEARIRRILVSRGRDASRYWREAGTERFRREAMQDGLTAPEADALVAKIGEQFETDDLDAILRSLRQRLAIESEREAASGRPEVP